MVSKVAVIALVVIVAAPILLGYGLNFNEVTESDYRETTDSINVTQMLKTDTAYGFTYGNSYTNNTNFGLAGYSMPMMPIYNSVINSATSFPMYQLHYATGTAFSLGMTFAQYSDIFTFVIAEYGTSPGELQMIIKNDSSVVKLTVDYLHTAYYNEEDNSVKYTYYPGGDLTTVSDGTYVIGNTNYVLQLAKTGGDGTDVYLDLSRSLSTDYVDISAGYYFKSLDNDWLIKFPNQTRAVVLSVNLDSITDSSYSAYFSYQGIEYRLIKWTADGEEHWEIRNTNTGWQQALYYDKTNSNNTYQFYFEFYKVKEDSSYKYYQSHAEFRYVGSWSKIIGPANYYQLYYNDVNLKTSISSPDANMAYVEINNTSNNRSPLLRVDQTLFRSFEYLVIRDKAYSPIEFKTNPITTISDIGEYGESLEFGGHVYTVKDGKITIGSKSVALDGLKFSTTPHPSGYGYINKIGNTEISVTSAPSKITFNGQWVAAVSTASMETYNYTVTEWTPGQFAWDGMDRSFLMVGLITSFCAFVGLGIYAKNRRASVLPLMIVCGGAALVFLFML